MEPMKRRISRILKGKQDTVSSLDMDSSLHTDSDLLEQAVECSAPAGELLLPEDRWGTEVQSYIWYRLEVSDLVLEEIRTGWCNCPLFSP